VRKNRLFPKGNKTKGGGLDKKFSFPGKGENSIIYFKVQGGGYLKKTHGGGDKIPVHSITKAGSLGTCFQKLKGNDKRQRCRLKGRQSPSISEAESGGPVLKSVHHARTTNFWKKKRTSVERLMWYLPRNKEGGGKFGCGIVWPGGGGQG